MIGRPLDHYRTTRFGSPTARLCRPFGMTSPRKARVAGEATSTPKTACGAAYLTATVWRCSIRRRGRSRSGRLPRRGRVLMTRSSMTRRMSWTAGMDNDFAVRLNTQTGEFTEYLLPHETNVRHVKVQKSGTLSSLWLGDQHGNTIIRVEPLAP